MGWEVKTESKWEAKYRLELGNDEYERRLAVARQKCEELRAKSDDSDNDAWQEAMFMCPQIESIAMQLKPHQFETAKNWPASKWVKLIYKVVGI